MSIYLADGKWPVQGPHNQSGKRLLHGAVELPKDGGGGQESPDGIHHAGQEQLRQKKARNAGVEFSKTDSDKDWKKNVSCHRFGLKGHHLKECNKT